MYGTDRTAAINGIVTLQHSGVDKKNEFLKLALHHLLKKSRISKFARGMVFVYIVRAGSCVLHFNRASALSK